MLEITRGGTAKAWIVYRPFSGRATITPASAIHAPLLHIKAPAAYLEFRGLSFDGRGTDAWEAALVKRGVHHVRFLNNDISKMGAAGIATISTDYMTFVGNRIYRFGDGVGWSSGISLNSSFGPFWYDSATGFHNVVANNIVTGGVDNSAHHSDGNGIIVDLGGEVAPTLIANNLVYQNGGRCIENLGVNHVWVVNNTCYMNGLDDRLGPVGEIQNNNVRDVHVINNVAVAWGSHYPFRNDGDTEVTFIHNVASGGIASLVGDAISANSDAIRVSGVGFVDPIRVEPLADRQWLQAMPPTEVSGRFRPEPASALRTAGADPRSDPGATAEYDAAFERYLSQDLGGNPRWLDGRYSVGAYD